MEKANSTLHSRTTWRDQFIAQLTKHHKDASTAADLLSRPAQLNVLAGELASEVLEDLRAADKPTEFYQLPARRVYLRDGPGYITSCEKRRLTTNSLSTTSERPSNSAMIGPTTFLIPSTGLPID
jgi:hypothetical protein